MKNLNRGATLNEKKYFKNVNTGEMLTEREYNELLLREAQNFGVI